MDGEFTVGLALVFSELRVLAWLSYIGYHSGISNAVIFPTSSRGVHASYVLCETGRLPRRPYDS